MFYFFRFSVGSSVEYGTGEVASGRRGCYEMDENYELGPLSVPYTSMWDTILPDYIKQSSERQEEPVQNAELHFSISSSENGASERSGCDGTHYSDCRQPAVDRDAELRSILPSMCPACKRKISGHHALHSRPASGHNKGDIDEFLLRKSILPPPNDSTDNRSSASDESVDSGYSPESPS